MADVSWVQPAAVYLSASTEESAESLVALYRRLNGQGDAILGYGGRIFNERPELIETVPAMRLGDDAFTAIEWLEPLVAERIRIPG